MDSIRRVRYRFVGWPGLSDEFTLVDRLLCLCPSKTSSTTQRTAGFFVVGGHEASDQGQITKAGHWLEPHNLSKEQDRPAFFGRFLEAPGSVSASTSSSSAAVFHRPSTTQPDSQRSRRARRQAGALPVASLISTPRSPGRPVDEAIRLFPQTTSSTRVRVDLLVPELTTVVSFSRVLGDISVGHLLCNTSSHHATRNLVGLMGIVRPAWT